MMEDAPCLVMIQAPGLFGPARKSERERLTSTTRPVIIG